MRSDADDPREQLAATMSRIYRRGLTTASGGNLSIRDESGTVWMTPAGLDKGRLEARDVVGVRPDGSIEGDGRPSSELPFHTAVYRARADVGAVVHAHPPMLTAYAVCREVPDPAHHPIARARCGVVGLVAYALTGTEVLASRIAETFAAGCDGAILENHGVVVGGGDLAEAFVRLQTLEWLATVLARARTLGGAAVREDLTAGETACPAPLPVAHAAAGDVERERRESVAAFARRAAARGLLAGADGTLSARLDETSFVITPTGIDREVIEPADLALVTGVETDPAFDARVHRAIYAARPDIRSVLLACPPCATAFAVSGAALDARLVSESYLVLREIVTVETRAVRAGAAAIAESLGASRCAAILPGLGALTVGRSTLEAFDRLEVLELTARTLIEARAVGEPRPLSAEAIREMNERS